MLSVLYDCQFLHYFPKLKLNTLVCFFYFSSNHYKNILIQRLEHGHSFNTELWPSGHFPCGPQNKEVSLLSSVPVLRVHTNGGKGCK